jgi:hypothetical protein
VVAVAETETLQPFGSQALQRVARTSGLPLPGAHRADLEGGA